MKIEFWVVLLMLSFIFQTFFVFKLTKEVNLQNMLLDFDAKIIEDRERLLKENGIKYDDYIFVEKE